MGERNTCCGQAPETEAGKDAGAGGDAAEESAGEAAGGGQDINAVLAQVSALQSEIDRLIALVNTAAKKLED